MHWVVSNSHLGFAGGAVVVVVAGDVMQLFHRVVPARGERLALGRGRVHTQGIVQVI